MGKRLGLAIGCILLFLSVSVPLYFSHPGALSALEQNVPQVSDHFDGTHFFNPPEDPTSPSSKEQEKVRAGWIMRWLFEKPEWPEKIDVRPGPPPAARLPNDVINVVAAGHSTFLIQMEGQNILLDPIWSERCGPLSWLGPKRHKAPGIGFDDLPPIDLVLISHNHYDHLDIATLKRLAERGTTRAVVPLGCARLVQCAGIRDVTELDWWQSLPASASLKITLTPARHFSSRTFWDRNETLWGSFVISGPSDHLFYAGDSGYGPHFREIARRLGPIRLAILPIAPFPPRPRMLPVFQSSRVHMGPWEAVRAHLDLGAGLSVAAHFGVFQLGLDNYGEAVGELEWALEQNRLKSGAFIAPDPGRSVALMATGESLKCGQGSERSGTQGAQF